MALTRVLILAPNLLLRIGLREMLRGPSDLAIVGDASSPNELESIHAEADIIVVASAPTHWFSFEGRATNLLSDQVVLLLSDDPELGKALTRRTGLWGLLPQNPTPEELLAGVRALSAGLAVFPPHLAGVIFQKPDRGDENPFDQPVEPLTAREGEILGLLAQGLPNKQIAARLRISEHTVKFHISSVYTKLGATNRMEAVRVGIQRGLVIM